MNCPLCRNKTRLAFEIKGHDLLDCLECSHRFTGLQADESHTARIYDNSYFTGGEAGYSDYLVEADMLIGRGRMYAKKIRPYINTGKMLDVGAAAGFILKGFTDSEWTGVGLEPNGAMVEFGRNDLGLDMRRGTLESFENHEKFDLVSMIQVAAHFYDARTAFEKAAALLNENGCLLIETWDRDSVSARIFGKNWHEYSPPSVLHWFSQKGLTVFLEKMGFEKIAGGRPSKKISGGHARSLLRYRLGDTFLLKLIPEKFNFPYPSEDLFWALYRKK